MTYNQEWDNFVNRVLDYYFASHKPIPASSGQSGVGDHWRFVIDPYVTMEVFKSFYNKDGIYAVAFEKDVFYNVSEKTSSRLKTLIEKYKDAMDKARVDRGNIKIQELINKYSEKLLGK